MNFSLDKLFVDDFIYIKKYFDDFNINVLSYFLFFGCDFAF